MRLGKEIGGIVDALFFLCLVIPPDFDHCSHDLDITTLRFALVSLWNNNIFSAVGENNNNNKIKNRLVHGSQACPLFIQGSVIPDPS